MFVSSLSTNKPQRFTVGMQASCSSRSKAFLLRAVDKATEMTKLLTLVQTCTDERSEPICGRLIKFKMISIGIRINIYLSRYLIKRFWRSHLKTLNLKVMLCKTPWH